MIQSDGVLTKPPNGRQQVKNLDLLLFADDPILFSWMNGLPLQSVSGRGGFHLRVARLMRLVILSNQAQTSDQDGVQSTPYESMYHL